EAMEHRCDGTNIAQAKDGTFYCGHCGWNDPNAGRRARMKIGTRSLLFGAHQFLIHPWFVAEAWRRLFGFPWDPRLWVLFFVHDWGYFGKPNMDGREGERHPELGARIMHALFDWRMVCPGEVHTVAECNSVRSRRWHDMALYHSRFLAKQAGKPVSKFCYADKLAIALT